MENAKTRENSEKKSVIPSLEKRVEIYSLYSYMINPEKWSNELKQREDATTKRRILTPDASSFKERLKRAFDDVEKQPVYKRYGDDKEEVLDFFLSGLQQPAEAFLNQREEKLRTTFCKEYLAPLVLAGMKSGVFVNTWWRAVACYGFSVEPFTDSKDGGSTVINAFPYSSLEEMKEGDLTAFSLTVQDVYYAMEAIAWDRQANRKAEAEEWLDEAEKRGSYFTYYPKDGLTAEELLQAFTIDGKEDTTVEDLYSSWYFDIALRCPIAISRQDEAIYYALKYIGDEYKGYIAGLSAEQDFNYGTKDEKHLYKNIMKEGYLWHSEK